MENIETILAQSPNLALLSNEKLQTLLRTRYSQKISIKKIKEIREALAAKHVDAREIITSKPKRSRHFFRLTGPIYSFQIDVMFMKSYKTSNKGYDRALVLVDQLSRKPS